MLITGFTDQVLFYTLGGVCVSNKGKDDVPTPSEYYQEQINTGAVVSDPQQQEVLISLDEIQAQLVEQSHWFNRVRCYLRQQKPVRGLYLWGAVGRGKSFLMDLFFKAMPLEKKKRYHFHHFMQLIHQGLRCHQGQVDPLKRVACEFAQSTRLLCLDELIVSDILDAMLLGRLFQYLFRQGVCLMTTSNIPPDDLYRNGLQRERFLPTIEQLKRCTQIIHLNHGYDHRFRLSSSEQSYFSPLTSDTERHLSSCFDLFSKKAPISTTPLMILKRPVKPLKYTKGVIWFDFCSICGPPRCKNDYLELVHRYHTVFISHVPQMISDAHDFIYNFIHLVDVFYDCRIRLVLSAQTEISALYPKGPMAFEFKRTHSRLVEMQSEKYFGIDNDSQLA